MYSCTVGTLHKGTQPMERMRAEIHLSLTSPNSVLWRLAETLPKDIFSVKKVLWRAKPRASSATSTQQGALALNYTKAQGRISFPK